MNGVDTMRTGLRRVVICASSIAAALTLAAAGPAAQQYQGPSSEAMQRAQDAYQAEKQRDAIAHNKAGVVQQLMDRWHENIGDTEKGHEGFEGAFMRANPEKLLQMTQAKTWDAVVATMLGVNPEATLGSASNDLVFNPVVPCRVMDSRFGTGVYAGPYGSGNTVSLYVTDPLTVNGHAQGGASSCGIPFGVGSAVALNITVVPLIGSGDLRIF